MEASPSGGKASKPTKEGNKILTPLIPNEGSVYFSLEERERKPGPETSGKNLKSNTEGRLDLLTRRKYRGDPFQNQEKGRVRAGYL